MPIEETVTVSLFAETGHATWFDFVFHITGYSASNGKYDFSYKDAQGDQRRIQLDIPQFLLERLALEEEKAKLPLFNAPSFAAFNQLAEDRKIRKDHQFYYFDVVVRDKSRQIVLKRLRYQIAEIERLQAWERQYNTETVYIEKREACNGDCK
jgi:hypothetical protein